MKYVEFTGISGVGKSTIYNSLIGNHQFYGGYEEKAVERIQLNWVERLLYYVAIISKIERGITHTLSKDYYRKFCREHSDVAIHGVANVKREPNEVKKLLRETAWKYQLGKETVQKDEILVIDEGFFHRAASIAVRSEKYNLPSNNTYFEHIPYPDILVHVTASNETINNRKRKRDGEMYKEKELIKIKKMINELCNIAECHGVNIIKINNKNGISQTTENLKRKIFDVNSINITPKSE